MKRAFVFPGQGSQAVGMGAALSAAFPAAREVFEEVDEALSQNLSKIMAEGPEDELTLTENAQPALMAVSMAVVRTLEQEGKLDLAKSGAFTAGHSLGEYSALAAAGTLTLADAARLLKRRGQAMQAAVPVGEGAMAALLGLDLATAQAVSEEAAQGEVICPANDNADGQVVVSGARSAVERALEIAKEKGAKRAVLLPVSAPFHCPLMAPAAEAMEAALAETDLAPPRLPMVANVTAEAVTEPETIRRLLVEQVTGMVRWRESVAYMAAHEVEELVELGSGKVLSGLARRIDRSLSARSVGAPEDIENFLNSL
jgi:[acyl-carrier-protein] S-malonyltransferase